MQVIRRWFFITLFCLIAGCESSNQTPTVENAVVLTAAVPPTPIYTPTITPTPIPTLAATAPQVLPGSPLASTVDEQGIKIDLTTDFNNDGF